MARWPEKFALADGKSRARTCSATRNPPTGNRFPLLCKILDAREKLSLQVHPPANKAAELGGEPKTEMWFIADAAPGAELFVGLKRGITRPEFEKKIRTGEVAGCFHRIPVRAGDAMFLPSGRVHAIGAGLVIFEIQQNSDTTYRVFDWNRVGLDGKPRELHVAQSLASIDFNDFEPALVQGKFAGEGNQNAPAREVIRFQRRNGGNEKRREQLDLKPRKLQIVAAVSGRLEIKSGSTSVNLAAGQFCLIPASLEQTEILAKSGTMFLRVEAN